MLTKTIPINYNYFQLSDVSDNSERKTILISLGKYPLKKNKQQQQLQGKPFNISENTTDVTHKPAGWSLCVYISIYTLWLFCIHLDG